MAGGDVVAEMSHWQTLFLTSLVAMAANEGQIDYLVSLAARFFIFYREPEPQRNSQEETSIRTGFTSRDPPAVNQNGFMNPLEVIPLVLLFLTTCQLRAATLTLLAVLQENLRVRQPASLRGRRSLLYNRVHV